MQLDKQKNKIETVIEKKEQTWLPEGKDEGSDKLGEWDWHTHTLLFIKQTTNQDLLYSTGNSTP